MTFNFEIKSFQVLHGSKDNADVVIVIGMGSDGWMYEYLGEGGVWRRLSDRFPHSIMLPGVAEAPLNSVMKTTMDEEVKQEVAAEPVAEAPAVEPMQVDVPPSEAPAAAE